MLNLKQLNTSFNKAMNNTYVSGALTLFLILYASMVRPELPPTLMNMFDSSLFRVVFSALIVYTASHNLQVSVLIAVVFVLSMNVLNEQKIAEGFKMGLEEEGFIPMPEDMEMQGGAEDSESDEESEE